MNHPHEIADAPDDESDAWKVAALSTSTPAAGAPSSKASSALQRILAENIRQLVWRHHDKTHGAKEKRPSVNAWAIARGLDDKIVHRVLGPRSITVVTLEHIAQAEGLAPWQLLVPDLNPESPPPIANELSALAIDLARSLDKIKDPKLREKCYALAIRRIELEIEDGPALPAAD